MERQEPIDAKALIDEVERYLAAVEVFRAHDCEPTWRPEPTTDVAWASAPAQALLLPADISLH